jgi:hypothetical protein
MSMMQNNMFDLGAALSAFDKQTTTPIPSTSTTTPTTATTTTTTTSTVPVTTTSRSSSHITAPSLLPPPSGSGSGSGSGCTPSIISDSTGTPAPGVHPGPIPSTTTTSTQLPHLSVPFQPSSELIQHPLSNSGWHRHSHLHHPSITASPGAMAMFASPGVSAHGPALLSSSSRVAARGARLFSGFSQDGMGLSLSMDNSLMMPLTMPTSAAGPASDATSAGAAVSRPHCHTAANHHVQSGISSAPLNFAHISAQIDSDHLVHSSPGRMSLSPTPMSDQPYMRGDADQGSTSPHGSHIDGQSVYHHISPLSPRACGSTDGDQPLYGSPSQRRSVSPSGFSSLAGGTPAGPLTSQGKANKPDSASKTKGKTAKTKSKSKTKPNSRAKPKSKAKAKAKATSKAKTARHKTKVASSTAASTAKATQRSSKTKSSHRAKAKNKTKAKSVSNKKGISIESVSAAKNNAVRKPKQAAHGQTTVDLARMFSAFPHPSRKRKQPTMGMSQSGSGTGTGDGGAAVATAVFGPNMRSVRARFESQQQPQPFDMDSPMCSEAHVDSESMGGASSIHVDNNNNNTKSQSGIAEADNLFEHFQHICNARGFAMDTDKKQKHIVMAVLEHVTKSILSSAAHMSQTDPAATVLMGASRSSAPMPSAVPLTLASSKRQHANMTDPASNTNNDNATATATADAVADADASDSASASGEPSAAQTRNDRFVIDPEHIFRTIQENKSLAALLRATEAPKNGVNPDEMCLAGYTCLMDRPWGSRHSARANDMAQLLRTAVYSPCSDCKPIEDLLFRAPVRNAFAFLLYRLRTTLDTMTQAERSHKLAADRAYIRALSASGVSSTSPVSRASDTFITSDASPISTLALIMCFHRRSWIKNSQLQALLDLFQQGVAKLQPSFPIELNEANGQSLILQNLESSSVNNDQPSALSRTVFMYSSVDASSDHDYSTAEWRENTAAAAIAAAEAPTSSSSSSSAAAASSVVTAAATVSTAGPSAHATSQLPTVLERGFHDDLENAIFDLLVVTIIRKHRLVLTFDNHQDASAENAMRTLVTTVKNNDKKRFARIDMRLNYAPAPNAKALCYTTSQQLCDTRMQSLNATGMMHFEHYNVVYVDLVLWDTAKADLKRVLLFHLSRGRPVVLFLRPGVSEVGNSLVNLVKSAPAL